jgi:hypothetical protein
MSTPFTASGVLTYPPDTGEAAADRPASVQGQFDEKSCHELNLTGAGTHNVGFGTIDTDGAKAVMVEVDTTASAPVMVQVNGGGAGGQWELSAGGYILMASPNPTTNGVLSMELVHTQDAKVWVRILG